MDLVGERIYSCYRCRNNVSFQDDIIDKNFVSGGGRAFLFTDVTNIKLGPKEERELISGRYSICDVFCCNCHLLLGWKYLHSPDAINKWKEGRIALSSFCIVNAY